MLLLHILTHRLVLSMSGKALQPPLKGDATVVGKGIEVGEGSFPYAIAINPRASGGQGFAQPQAQSPPPVPTSELQNTRPRNAPPGTSVDDGKAAVCGLLCVAGIMFIVFIGAIVIAVQESATSGDATGHSGPTKSPTRSPTDVLKCPARFGVFFGEVRATFSIIQCRTEGCGGSLEWCGLDNARQYRVEVKLFADHRVFGRNTTFELDGNFTEVWLGGPTCRFGQVLNQTVFPTDGNIILYYKNSPLVTPSCGGGNPQYSSQMEIFLVEVPLR